jgi:hypothetical protein
MFQEVSSMFVMFCFPYELNRLSDLFSRLMHNFQRDLCQVGPFEPKDGCALGDFKA